MKNCLAILFLMLFSVNCIAKAPSPSQCLPSSPCWPSAKDWGQLSNNLQGQLLQPVSPMATCKRNVKSEACKQAIRKTNNPFFLQKMPAGAQSQGWLGAWQDKMSVYAVVAESTKDVVSAVNFARKHRIKLVIKGAGHDYLGRSNAPNSLLVWTRKMRQLNFHNSFIPVGCNNKPKGLTAVTFGAGARWIDVYNEVTNKHHQYVQGGGCTTVGAAGGFTQGGGFGSYSKQFGTGAAGVLQFEIVIADGRVLSANRCQNQDLFWAVRGGGGGTFGIVTRMTLMTHPLPKTLGIFKAKLNAKNDASYKKLIQHFLVFYRRHLNNPHWGEQFSFNNNNEVNIFMMYQGMTLDEVNHTWSVLKKWMSKYPKLYSIQKKITKIPPQKMWNYQYWHKHHPNLVIKNNLPGASPGQYWWAPNSGEVYKYWYTYQSRWIPISLFSDKSVSQLAEVIFKASRLTEVSLHANKGLAGASRDAVLRGRETSTNPAVYKAAALLIMSAGSNTVRLGVKGFEPNKIKAKSIVAKINQAMSLFEAITPHAGTYANEANYFQKNWQYDFWGVNYPKLLKIKRKYDPTGFFYCHHCVATYPSLNP